MSEPPVPRTRWEQRTELPLALLAVLFVGAYAWPILDPDLARPWSTLCTAVVWGSWAAFAVDLAVRLHQAPSRRAWLLRHVLDVVVLVLPMLRPLRALRVVNALRVLNRATASTLRGRVGLYVGAGSSLLALLAALAVLDAERGAPDANITSFGDAVWWACATMSTVGYGDRFPVTGQGRLIGVGLMVGGIALLGTVTATLASWLVQSVATETAEAVDARDEVEQERADERDAGREVELAALRDELTALRADVAALTAALAPGPSAGPSARPVAGPAPDPGA